MTASSLVNRVALTVVYLFDSIINQPDQYKPEQTGPDPVYKLSNRCFYPKCFHSSRLAQGTDKTQTNPQITGVD